MAAQSTFSLAFNGATDKVTLGSPVSEAGDFTLSCWVKFAASPASNNLLWLANSGDGGMNLWGVLSDATTIYYRGTTGGTNTLNTFTVPTLTTGTWYHMALTRNGGSGVILLYVDGTQYTTGVGNLDPLAFNTLGAYPANTAFNFVGSLDDFACCASVLTPTQVANIAGTPGTAGSSSLDIATLTCDTRYRMETGSGTNVADSSGNGNDGTISGGVTWSADVAAPLQASSSGSVGASAGTSTCTAVGASLAAGKGNPAGTSTVTAVGASLAAAAGSAAGLASVAAVGTSLTAAVGAAAGTSTVAAAGASLAAAVGAAAGISTCTGFSPAGSAGLAAGTCTVVGVGASLAAATGTASGTSTVVGVSPAAATVAGPYYFVAAGLYVAGASRGGIYTAGASLGAIYEAGAVAGQVTTE